MITVSFVQYNPKEITVAIKQDHNKLDKFFLSIKAGSLAAVVVLVAKKIQML